MAAFKEQDFKDHLARQLRFIERSCKAYDEGYTDEAIRVATQLRVIFHTGNKSRRSLLQHLNALRTSPLSTTEGFSEPYMGNTLFGLGSLRSTSDGTSVTVRYGPGFDNALTHKEMKFDRWWNQVVFVRDADTRLTRKDIVLDAANTDGGTHVGRELTPEYEKLSAPGTLGEIVERDNEGERRTPVTDLHFVAIRQMGYEVLHSPELLKLAGR